MKISVLKILFITFGLFYFGSALSQSYKNKIDYRVGSGISLVSTGDVRAFNFENEINFSLNNYLSTSVGIRLGQGLTDYVNPVVNYIQGNIIIYCSPFRNNKRVDFRLGLGGSYYFYNEMQIIKETIIDGEIVETISVNNKRKSLGANLVTELSFKMNEKFIIVTELYLQPYLDGNLISGFALGIGYKL